MHKFRAKLNAAKHGLSLPVDERVFADQITMIAKLIREDCSTETQAKELAKRIVDLERNEAFLQDFKEDELHDEITAWGLDPKRLTLARMANSLRAKQPVSITFTLPQKDRPVTLKGKERTEVLKFIEGFLKIQDRSMLGRVKKPKTLSFQPFVIKSERSTSWSRASEQLPKAKNFDFYKTKPIF